VDFDILWLIVAFGGGAFGAAIGGQTAFIFTGFAFLFGFSALLGGVPVAQDFIGMFAFGPVFGPHIAFAGGAAAAAYAAKRGYFAEGVNGRDIVTPLAGIPKADIFIVGGVFGMLGYVIERAVGYLFSLWAPEGEGLLFATDTVALTVVLSAVIARLAFGVKSKAIAGPFNGAKPLSLNDGTHWVEHQEKWSISALHGLMSGLLFAYVAVWVIENVPQDNPAYAGIISQVFLVGWAISAISLIFLSLGMKTPVTHHMTILAGLGAVQAYAAWDTGLIGSTLIGAAWGLIGGVGGEAFSRIFNARGDSHIDPPAGIIFIGTTAIYLVTTI
jgi:hypothetical protein